MAILSSRIRSILIFLLALSYLANVFIQSAAINTFNVMLMVIVIVLCFPVVTGSSRVIGYVSFAVSMGLLLFYKAPLMIWAQAVEENLYLVVMFALVPLLGIPIEHGGYSQALQGIFKRYVNTDNRFYLFVSLTAAFIGIMVSLAVVPMVYQITKASEKSKNVRLLATAISRGFTTCTIWAPTTAAIALVVEVTGASWEKFFPFALSCGIVCGLVGYGMNAAENKRLQLGLVPKARDREQKLSVPSSEQKSAAISRENKRTITPREQKTTVGPKNQSPKKPAGSVPDGDAGRKIMELSTFGIVLIVSIAVISMLTGMQTIIVVSLAALIFPVIWMGILGRLLVYCSVVRDQYFGVSLPKLKNELILFIAAGLLATSISYSHLGDYIPLLLHAVVGNNAFLLSVMVILICIILSTLGVHPIITVVIIGNTVNQAAYQISPTYMALLLAISWAMGITVSPSGATLIAISGLTGESTVTIGTRWNLLYVLAASVIMLLILALIRVLGIV